MRTLATASLALLLLCASGAVLAADLDNNGVAGDENFFDLGVFEGAGDRELVQFPTSGDTWEVSSYPYWWHVGDTVYGDHTVPLSCITHADVALKISYNVLSGGGHVDIDYRINGVTVGSFILVEGDGEGYVYGSFDFDPVAPPFELRLYETNLVDPGAGSISFDETGLCTVDFFGTTPVGDSSWSSVKSLF